MLSDDWWFESYIQDIDIGILFLGYFDGVVQFGQRTSLLLFRDLDDLGASFFDSGCT